MIDEHEAGHRLDHRDGAGQDARVMAAARGKFRRFAGDGNGLLLLGNRRHRLEGDAKDDVLAIGDAALNAAATIGQGLDGLKDLEFFLTEKRVTAGGRDDDVDLVGRALFRRCGLRRADLRNEKHRRARKGGEKTLTGARAHDWMRAR